MLAAHMREKNRKGRSCERTFVSAHFDLNIVQGLVAKAKKFPPSPPLWKEYSYLSHLQIDY